MTAIEIIDSRINKFVAAFMGALEFVEIEPERREYIRHVVRDQAELCKRRLAEDFQA